MPDGTITSRDNYGLQNLGAITATTLTFNVGGQAVSLQDMSLDQLRVAEKTVLAAMAGRRRNLRVVSGVAVAIFMGLLVYLPHVNARSAKPLDAAGELVLLAVMCAGTWLIVQLNFGAMRRRERRVIEQHELRLALIDQEIDLRGGPSPALRFWLQRLHDSLRT